MPSKTAHICEIKTSEGFDRVRFEPEEVPAGEKAAKVAGKRVLRKYGFKGDESEIIAYHFREKDGWTAGATGAAKSWCGEHEGTFIPMAKETTASLVYLGPHEGQGITAARLPDEGEELVWHLLLPFGHFEHHLYGPFDMTPQYGQEMVANFEAGFPLSLGIPIDEDNLHGTRREGAYGWIRALEVREEGEWGEAGVYGGITYTPAGVEAVQTKSLPYVSPRFWVGEDEHPALKRRNVIAKCALCSYPFFSQQPELQVATGDYVRSGLTAAATDSEHEALKKQQQARSSKYGIEVRSDGNLTPPAQHAAAAPNAGDYGDPVNYMYPLKPEGKLRNAAPRMSGNASGYKQEKSRRTVWTRIIRAQRAAGIQHRWGSPEALDRLLPPDLASWAKKNAGVTATTTLRTDPSASSGFQAAGGIAMEELMKQARAAYEKSKAPVTVTDEEWTKVSEGLATEQDWQDFIKSLEGEGAGTGTDQDVHDLAKLRADIEARDRDLAELRAKLTTAETAAAAAETEKNDLAARVGKLESDRQEAEVKQGLAATRLEGGFAYTGEAVDLLAADQLHHTPETSQALQKHLAVNGGKMATMPLGEVPMLKTATDSGEQTDEAWLAGKAIPEDTKDRTRKRAAKDKIGLRDAYDLVIKDMTH